MRWRLFSACLWMSGGECRMKRWSWPAGSTEVPNGPLDGGMGQIDTLSERSESDAQVHVLAC